MTELNRIGISFTYWGTSAALADHNSIWGAGWANMPNDIHNTRIEDDSETFLELVRYGGGADSINRYAEGASTDIRGGSSMGGGSLNRGSALGWSGRR